MAAVACNTLNNETDSTAIFTMDSGFIVIFLLN